MNFNGETKRALPITITVAGESRSASGSSYPSVIGECPSSVTCVTQ